MKEPNELTPASPETVAAFQARRDEIIQMVVAQSLEREDETAQHGAEAEPILTHGLEFTTDSLITAMQFGSLQILAQQLDWAHSRLPHDGVAPTHILNRLQLYSAAVAKLLPQPHAQVVEEYVAGMIAYQRSLVQG